VSGDERALHTGMRSPLTGPSIPPALAGGTIEILGLMPNSSNYTFLARCAGDGAGEDVLGIYKPARGESPLWDFPDGTLCRREVAAFEVARTLGWPNVPPTVLREGPEGIGSLQAFIEFDPDQHYFTLEGTHGQEFREIALFDHVVNNADRKAGHCLVGGDGIIWAIDHGVCFNEEPKLRTVIWEFAGEPIPAELLEDLKTVSPSFDPEGDLDERLAELLSEAERLAMRARVAALMSEGHFPEPGPGRPFPWPPI
jgi:uncharacterized repeat protein (TIGR03843 family)